jgi:two-component system, chemotaxis family, chemotaxis protein CheY
MIRIIGNLLKQLGSANVDEAGDRSAALDMMRQKDYGLVISDWNMEPMTGYELLREVPADDRLSRTPFIMVTAESKTDNVIAVKKADVMPGRGKLSAKRRPGGARRSWSWRAAGRSPRRSPCW